MVHTTALFSKNARVRHDNLRDVNVTTNLFRRRPSFNCRACGSQARNGKCPALPTTSNHTLGLVVPFNGEKSIPLHT